MDKENVILKINKYGKIGRIVTNIMLVLLAFVLVATIISAISLKIIPSDLITVNIGTQAECILNPSIDGNEASAEEINKMVSMINEGNIKSGLNLGVVSLKFDSASVVDGKIIAKSGETINNVSLSSIGTVLFLAAFTVALTFISVLFGKMLCKAFEKCESPFEDNVITKMRNFAFSLIPWALISSLPENALNAIFGNNLEFSFSLDFNVIFTVLIILALTMVFKYGAILQQESDETL